MSEKLPSGNRSNFVHSRWSGRLRSFRVILCRYPHTHFSTSVNIIRDITYMLEHLLQENTPFSVIFEANYWIPEWMCQFRTKESILWERSQGGESQLAKGASKEEGPPELGLSGHGDELRLSSLEGLQRSDNPRGWWDDCGMSRMQKSYRVYPLTQTNWKPRDGSTDPTSVRCVIWRPRRCVSWL